MIEFTCERCKKSFEGLTHLKRFCASCIKEGRNRKRREAYHKEKNGEPLVKLGGLTPCSWCKQPLRVTVTNRRVHDRCKAEHEKMLHIRSYERNREKRGIPILKRRFTERISTGLTPEMLVGFDKLCKKRRTYPSQLLRILIKKEIKRQEKRDA